MHKYPPKNVFKLEIHFFTTHSAAMKKKHSTLLYRFGALRFTTTITDQSCVHVCESFHISAKRVGIFSKLNGALTKPPAEFARTAGLTVHGFCRANKPSQHRTARFLSQHNPQPAALYNAHRVCVSCSRFPKSSAQCFSVARDESGY